MKFALLSLPLALATSLSVAQAPKEDFTDGVALLQAVAKSYAAEADMFRLESIKETLVNNDLEHEWTKVYRSAIKGPGAQYRIETRSPYGSFIQVSDGKNEWILLVETKKYVVRPLPQSWPGFLKVGFGGSQEINAAWNLRSMLRMELGNYQHATLLPQETISIEGRSYPCYVVHVSREDMGEWDDDQFQSDKTFWIDKSTLIVRKQVEHANTVNMIAPNVLLPLKQDITTTYRLIDLGPQTKPEIFEFTPPADATQVATLEPDYSQPGWRPGADRIGKTVPEISFAGLNGQTIELRSYRGKPLLVDFWATWCAPCLAAMPDLASIYTEAKAIGLPVITFDQDKDSEKAVAYLAQHHYDWPNFHDGDKKIGKAFRSMGIPLTVLLDAQGKIVYFDFGGNEAGLRKALAGLGPEYASLATGNASASGAAKTTRQ